MRVGFIGLGTMGYRMAKNVAKNFQLCVWDQQLPVARKHAQQCQSILCDNLAILDRSTEVIVTCLPTSHQVLQVAQQLEPVTTETDKYLVDCTSGDYQMTQQIHRLLSSKGITMLDCPVSGGTSKAEAGVLCCMVGGDEESYYQIKPVLDTFSKARHVGKIGSGHAVKSINNLLNVSNLITATEGLRSLREIGVKLETALEAINNSSGRSLMTLERLPNNVLTGKYDYDFLLSLMKKDVELALNIIQNQEIFTGIFQVVNDSLEHYGQQADYTKVSQYLLSDTDRKEK